MENLWPLLVMAVGVVVAIAQAFVKQGDVAIREQAVTVSEKELDLEQKQLAVALAKKTAERISVLEAANITFSTQLTAMTTEFSKVVQQYTVTQTELATVKAENAQLREVLAKVQAELTTQRDENAGLRAEIEALRERVTVTEARPPAPADAPHAPDPLAAPTKHKTAPLPALPADAPDAKRDAEAKA